MAKPGVGASALQSCYCSAQAKLAGSRLALPWTHPFLGPQRPTSTWMCLPSSECRLSSPAPATSASLALIPAWCRYWVAAVQNFDNTWVVNFTVFQDVYGTGGELVGADVNSLIPKPRMWLVAVYWALTTVQFPLAASQLGPGGQSAEVLPSCVLPRLVPCGFTASVPQQAGHMPAQQCSGWAAEEKTSCGVACCACLLLLASFIACLDVAGEHKFASPKLHLQRVKSRL